MLAGVIVLLLFINTIITIVLLMRYRELKKAEFMLRDEIRDMVRNEDKRLNAEQQQLEGAVQQAEEVLSSASPEDVKAALDMLRKMGIDA